MANPNPGPNNRCRCGSGKKYKQCHLRADDQRFQQVFSEEYCLHPDAPKECSSIIRAHTIQQRGQLDRISDGNANVIGVDLRYPMCAKGCSPFAPISVRKASVRWCFCAHHDDEIFNPIESAAIQFTSEQCLLFGYRAVCRGVYLSRQLMKVIPSFGNEVDHGKAHVEQESRQAKLEVFEQTKKLYDDVLRNGNFGEIAFFAIELAKVPDILGSNVFLPPCDFTGAQLQSLAIGSKIDVLTFSLIATPKDCGAAVFVWHKQHDKACRAFVDSLRRLPEGGIPHAITRLVFSFCENSYFSPAWWSGLPAETKGALQQRFLQGMRGHDNQSLVEDSVRAVDWLVTGFRQ